MIYEFNHFSLEDNSHLGMSYYITNPAMFRFCFLTTRLNKLAINVTGTLLNFDDAICYKQELALCIEALTHFNSILNK